MDERLIGLAEAADRIGVSYNTALRLVKNGKLKAFRIGRDWKIDPAIVEFGRSSADQQINALVRKHIDIIEFALLGLSNSEAMNGLINMSAEEIAKLANTLRELTDE